MLLVRRLVLVVTLAVLVSATAYGAGWASKRDDRPAPAPVAVGSPAPDVAPHLTPTPAPITAPEVEPDPEPVVPLLEPGDEGPQVRELQARLAQIDWFLVAPTGSYGDLTAEAVSGFQAKRGLPATGSVDRPTMDRLLGMTTEPTAAQLRGITGNVPGPLDPRCTTGRVICVDKTSQTLRWVVDGEVLQTLDTRFGRVGMETREGVFHVERKSRDHVSTIYDTSMPFAMFFSGGQAVHYSPDFAAVGYAGASHGCVNVRDYDGIAWLFDQVREGDKVVVSWS